LERECIDFFSGACENLRSQFIQSLSRQFITSSEGECFSIEQLACLGQFFRWPLYSTPEMREHMARYRLAEAVGFLPYPWPELTQEYAAIAFRSMYENFPYPR
jgi:hypothetical protein